MFATRYKAKPKAENVIWLNSTAVSASLQCDWEKLGQIQDQLDIASTLLGHVCVCVCRGHTQKNGAVSKINKKFISHLTRAQRTPSAAATVQVSHALPAVRFSCLQRGQFPRWCRSRKRLSVCSDLRCPDLWLQCSVSFVHVLEKTHAAQ